MNSYPHYDVQRMKSGPNGSIKGMDSPGLDRIRLGVLREHRPPLVIRSVYASMLHNID